MGRSALSGVTAVAVAAVAVAEAFVCSATLAHASSDDKRARAEVLNSEAAAEMAAGNYASACPKFKQVVELVPTGIGAKMSVAQCHERWGRLATALKAYRLAEQAASSVRDPRAAVARAKAAALEIRVATLRVVVPKPVAALRGLQITLDGEALAPEAWDKRLPIDKGTYTLRATAEGEQFWIKQANIHVDGFEASYTVNTLPHPRPAAPRPPASP